MHTPPCHRTPLAAGDFAMVELCTCGAVHVTVGAVTLRLVPAAVGELAEVIGEAARELALRDARAARSSFRAEACS